ncbi:alpha/beta hydrolase [Rhodococcus chondri]|uniref:Alpha/beta hydrolase n=1 Tax=Rhodococcus chondri TaxID=3065941 RepID=A0ABU7JPP6_9NOCA|nr:alpha/beta hydrolase [Rhodococcus sp. CC-R104]MEE2032003.1 alpha/beta hydrolase [Rhodococcus sp. CC-R104]
MTTDSDTPTTRSRHTGRWILIGIAVILAITVLAFTFSPTPGALVVRAVFERDAHEATVKLDEGAPATDLTRDLQYREGDADAYLDVYTPTGNTDTLPTIVWTHGGAWLAGNRTNYDGYYRRLADAGFTVVSVGYSLAPGHRYPTAVHQLNDAHAYLLAHADELHIDPDRIVLAGDSAGAQLSAQLATGITDPGYATTLALEPALKPQQLRGVVLNCGIYNVPAMEGGHGLIGWGVQQALWAYTGARDFGSSEAARQMSALFAVTAEFPPTFVTGGNADPLTATQSRPLADKLTRLGVEVDALFYPDDHTPELSHEYQFDLSTQDARTALDRTISFVGSVTG